MSLRPELGGVAPLTVNLVQRVCLGDLPTRAAQQFPHRPAVVDGDVVLTYSELEARSNAAAAGLLDLGLQRGDVVAMLMPNSWEFLVTFFGCAKIGVVCMPVNLGVDAEGVAFQFDDARPKVVVVEESFAVLLETAIAATTASSVQRIVVSRTGAPPAELAGTPVMPFAELVRATVPAVEVIVEDRDIAQCLYTSGTTSRPKAVLTSHVAVMMAALSTCVQFRHERGDNHSVFPIVLPLFHVTALNSLTLPVLLTGGTVVLHRSFDPNALLRDLADRQVTHLMLLPIMWGQLVDAAGKGAPGSENVRMAIYAMAPMSQQRLDDVREVFPNADVVLGSGQTEFTPPSVLQWPSHQWDKNASWGTAVITTDVRIMGPNGELLPRGQEGEIVYRGPQAMQGYGNNEAANTAAFTRGWFHSGDVGYIDDEGVLWFTDRIKDIVKSGGENVSSVEVERALLGHPDVADCAVIGMPDERWGESVTAVVVPVPGRTISDDAIRYFAKEHLAGYKVPKRVIVVNNLPKTSTGKIQKHRVRAQLESRSNPQP
ncbi:AMP-dependent synthetase [Rhodococcus ruber]|uniref:class I adenylate-forming enzyme family protein n=1 Tax=Rhodococcus TaxID=1827 RepID=UPI00029B4630|nr:MULTISPECIES: AMP-binding protein [Rhodococcus]ATQ29311.1 AMP-dependent synthetase [Rhodococcus ruber]MBC2589261.1 AMP-binding protein [Rhodococcus aetherivorans]